MSEQEFNMLNEHLDQYESLDMDQDRRLMEWAEKAREKMNQWRRDAVESPMDSGSLLTGMLMEIDDLLGLDEPQPHIVRRPLNCQDPPRR